MAREVCRSVSVHKLLSNSALSNMLLTYSPTCVFLVPSSGTVMVQVSSPVQERTAKLQDDLRIDPLLHTKLIYCSKIGKIHKAFPVTKTTQGISRTSAQGSPKNSTPKVSKAEPSQGSTESTVRSHWPLPFLPPKLAGWGMGVICWDKCCSLQAC